MPSKQDFLRTINLKEDYNYNFLKFAVKNHGCLLESQERTATKYALRPMIEYILKESKSLSVFLDTVDELLVWAED